MPTKFRRDISDNGGDVNTHGFEREWDCHIGILQLSHGAVEYAKTYKNSWGVFQASGGRRLEGDCCTVPTGGLAPLLLPISI